jgi:hypothetical protein
MTLAFIATAVFYLIVTVLNKRKANKLYIYFFLSLAFISMVTFFVLLFTP